MSGDFETSDYLVIEGTSQKTFHVASENETLEGRAKETSFFSGLCQFSAEGSAALDSRFRVPTP
jgi:hypothetical protein